MSHCNRNVRRFLSGWDFSDWPLVLLHDSQGKDACLKGSHSSSDQSARLKMICYEGLSFTTPVWLHLSLKRNSRHHHCENYILEPIRIITQLPHGYHYGSSLSLLENTAKISFSILLYCQATFFLFDCSLMQSIQILPACQP